MSCIFLLVGTLLATEISINNGIEKPSNNGHQKTVKPHQQQPINHQLPFDQGVVDDLVVNSITARPESSKKTRIQAPIVTKVLKPSGNISSSVVAKLNQLKKYHFVAATRDVVDTLVPIQPYDLTFGDRLIVSQGGWLRVKLTAFSGRPAVGAFANVVRVIQHHELTTDIALHHIIGRAELRYTDDTHGYFRIDDTRSEISANDLLMIEDSSLSVTDNPQSVVPIIPRYSAQAITAKVSQVLKRHQLIPGQLVWLSLTVEDTIKQADIVGTLLYLRPQLPSKHPADNEAVFQINIKPSAIAPRGVGQVVIIDYLPVGNMALGYITEITPMPKKMSLIASSSPTL